MGTIKFEKVLKKMIDVENKKISTDEFNEWLKKNITVKEYLPIVEKYSIIKLFSLDFEYKYMEKLISDELEISADMFYMQYDILSLFELLFAYTNIEITVEDKTTENYDYIYKSKLYNYILDKCSADYLSLKEKCGQVVGVNDMTIIAKLGSFVRENANVENLNTSIDKIEKLLKDEDISKNLKFMNNIEMFNNPHLKELIENVQKESMEEIGDNKLN